ncbi:hypothetical protein Q8W15_24180 [Photobacterium damselae subsp. piscicida]|nr:hypothetical protein [Photobacterium damselae subsp. piscicida]MDP2515939.1 hypothetical protein [Photobacterium damselae subsp. piscicida]MDP2532000.1 hypothetical protein [Photobacterium damselae subsp. piscicida]MDP2533880.1 hypothetical protein [Photobacterium damselae subsp. piscicida]MDP2556203.1 hypothetical protein [Photobacterium damselae subsp. piscicida]
MSQIDCDTEHDEIKQLGTITGQDIGEDFIIFPIEVPMYVTMKVVQDEGGELKPELVAKLSRKTKKPKMRTLPLILHPSGVPLLVENLFLRYLMQEEIRNDESLERLAIGLLGFCRFCHASEWLDDSGNSAPMTYRSLCHDPEEGAPWLYGDFLFDNLHKRDPSTGIVVEEGYAPSTAKFNIRVVARFYAWLLDMGYITFNEDYKAFNEKYIELRRRGDKDSQSSGADKKMLSHTFSGSGNGYKRMIRTSDFLKRFTDVAAMSDIEEWKSSTL